MKQRKKSSKAENLAGRFVGGSISQMATYSDLFSRTADAIFLVDLDTGRVLECNPAVEKTLSSPLASLQGNDLVLLAHPSSRSELEAKITALRNGESLEKPFDCVFVTRQGANLIHEVSACRLKLADYCEIIQVIARDVTEARKAARELESANERLAHLSSTDEMTGLFNFRHLKSEMKREHERASRYSSPYSVILCDIDHFKHYNDRNGHLDGDIALKKVADALKERARASDLVARYGGEEFVVFCPGTDAAQAQLLAEALRARVEAGTFPHGDKQPLGKLTISVGVASFPKDGSLPDDVLKASDVALYSSKEKGRNRVTLSISALAGKSVKKAA